MVKHIPPSWTVCAWYTFFMRNPEFFLHGSSNSKDVERITKDGFVARKENGTSIEEGRVTFTINLFKALEFASHDKEVSSGSGFDGGGGIVIFKRSSDAQYVIAPTPKGYIFEDGGAVRGNAKHFSEGRSHLGYFSDSQSHERAISREAHIRHRMDAAPQERIQAGTELVPREDVVGIIPSSPEVRDALSRIKSNLYALEYIDLESAVRELSPHVSMRTVGGDTRDALVRSLIVDSCASEMQRIMRSSFLADAQRAGASIEKKFDPRAGRPSETKDFSAYEGFMNRITSAYADPHFSLGIPVVDRYVRSLLKYHSLDQ